MSKRYYLSNVETYSGEDGSIVRKAVVSEYADYTAEILGDQALCIVAAGNHSLLLSDPRIDALPIFPLDGKINAMQAASKNAMISNLNVRGYATGFISSADGYRDVIRGVGKSINPNFDENNFDISE